MSNKKMNKVVLSVVFLTIGVILGRYISGRDFVDTNQEIVRLHNANIKLKEEIRGQMGTVDSLIKKSDSLSLALKGDKIVYKTKIKRIYVKKMGYISSLSDVMANRELSDSLNSYIRRGEYNINGSRK